MKPLVTLYSSIRFTEVCVSLSALAAVRSRYCWQRASSDGSVHGSTDEQCAVNSVVSPQLGSVAHVEGLAHAVPDERTAKLTMLSCHQKMLRYVFITRRRWDFIL